MNHHPSSLGKQNKSQLLKMCQDEVADLTGASGASIVWRHPSKGSNSSPSASRASSTCRSTWIVFVSDLCRRELYAGLKILHPSTIWSVLWQKTAFRKSLETITRLDESGLSRPCSCQKTNQKPSAQDEYRCSRSCGNLRNLAG